MKNINNMKKYRPDFKKVLLVLIAVLGFGQYAMAGTYYAKYTAKVSQASTGEGLVYVGNNPTTPETFTEESSLTYSESSAFSDNVDITFYLFAKASTGSEFIGWADADNTETISSTDSPWQQTVTTDETSENPANSGTKYAIFKPRPTFSFSATAIATPTAGGTVTASVAEESKYGEHYNSTSASTTATFSVSTPNRGYEWVGWNESSTGTATTAQSMTYTVTNNSAGTTQNITRYAIFKKLDDPTAVSANNITLAIGETSTIVPMLTPTGCFSDLSFSSNATSVATVDAATGVVTGVSAGTATITITAKKIDPTQSVSTTITVTVKDKCATPTISFSNVTADGATATLATTTTAATIYYTINGSDPTASSTAYTAPFAVEPGDEVRAIAIVTGTDAAYWLPSDILTRTYSSCKVATPSILVDGDGKISFTCPEEGTVTYKYCISADGSCTPTTTWNGTPIAKNLANNEKIIKVIATNDDCLPSDPATKLYTASGTTTGGTVYLNDYEDHTWTYYAGVPTTVDGGNYNTNYAGKMYSPDPRNVKITYQANGGAVSISESETTFVYYKTIEKVGGTYKYQVISNPFSKRPTGKGFGGWKLKSITGTGASISGHSTTSNATLALDEELTLTLPDAGINGTSAEIVFEATWVDATIVKDKITGLNSSGTYETNIIVYTKNTTSNISPTDPCTIMMVEPDGSDDYRTYTFTGSITPPSGGIAKIEHAKWNPNGAIAMGGSNLWIGRGVTCSGTTRSVTLAGNNGTINQVAKIESGAFTSLTHYSSKPTSITKQILVLGNDYDRANSDNTKLTFSGRFEVDRCDGGSNYAQEACRVYSKSGSFMTGISIGSASRSDSYYLSYYSGTSPERSRYFEIEGGEWYANISGGQDNSTTANNYTAFTFRMRGGIVRGSIYGSAQQYNSHGNRILIFTGGQIGGWVAGAANGTSSNNGVLYGSTYVYFGGNAKIATQYQNRTNSSTTKINNSIGGNVFASGCGNGTGSSSGSVSVSSNGVIADNAEIEYGAYGGGAFGKSTNTANVYITGGHVKSLYDSQSTSFGGVYGGARQNDGKDVNIYMTGGQIDGVTYSSNHGGGLFGGSNASGTLSGNVNMVVTGGQVGTSTNPANIHGGGYGASTTVSQNVDVTLGLRDDDDITSGTAVVYGDVYGGSALGEVNGTTAADTYHTYVTLNAGTINGSLYGGALGATGTAANVYGPVKVKVYGGSVKKTDENGANGSGAVYGANNINGAPQRAVTVDIYGTDPAPAAGGYALFSVYGGGNKAGYTYGNGYPTVTVHNCDNSIEYVYGGGNAAAVAVTDVTIYGGNKIGNVFGGGNGQVTAANVNGNTSVNIYGGTIGDVYGGSNTNGTIGGTITVNVNSQAESTSGTACPMAIDNVYGGGNKAASNAGTVNIGCTGPYVAASEGVTESGYIRNVYGGANQANITGNIGLDIKAGHIDNVFGGNNNSGTINGTITVTVKEDNSCDEAMLVGNVYGGGNKAAYGSGANYPVVKIEKGHLSGSVFGGGLGSTAVVTGNPQVTIGSTTSTDVVTIDGNVFGGGDAANVAGSPVVLVQNCNTKIGKTSTTDGVTTYTNGSVYGGGNAAHVTGSSNSTSVTINGGTINRVFGGGNGEVSAANVEGNATTTIHAGTIHQAFAGSNAAGKISGTAKITVDKTGSCDEKIDELYGGGNLAEGNAGTVTVACGAIVDDVYGGANQAEVTSDITLNITGGTIKRVFGGNNTSGNITGSITVNIDKATDCSSFSVGNVYGAGNKAAYTPTTPGSYPAVNIKNGTVTYDVFGGGLGSTATVTSNPTVLVDGGTVSGNVFGGGSEANTVGNPSVTVKTGTVTKDVYGGGALANVTGNTTVSLTGGTVTGNTYGGGLGRLADAENSITAVAAMVTGNTTVTVNGGKSNNVFGCNNLNGGPTGDVTVTVTTGTITNNVYGGGNLAAATADPTVTVNGGTMKNVYGGGLGESAVITGDPIVNINKTATDMTVVDVFGGGDAAEVTGNTTVNLTAGSVTRAFGGGNLAAITGTTSVKLTGATAANVYGGGNEAGVSSTATIAMSAGSVTGGLYGGCNTKGKVSGDITVGVTGGTVGTDATHKANVHGGGYGSQTQTGGNVAVTINGSSATIYGDVYGGSALGNVNDASTETTTVTLTSGTINGDLYGGGLGDATNAAGVVGKTVVAINGGTVNNVFGCNNANGAPVGGATVTVNGGTINNNVYGGGNLAAASVSPVVTINNGTLPGSVFGGGKGAPSDASHETAMVTGNPQVVIGDDVSTHSVSIAGNVFGGGDAANVKGATTVTVNKCNTLIGAKTSGAWSTTAGTVYGGGNAADVVKNGSEGGSTSVIVNGGDIYRVFGGGNGEGASNPGANVANGTNVAIHAGNIHQAFAGSNAKGNITGSSAVTIDHDISTCNELVDEVYGGGNLAAGNAGEITVECGAVIGDLYGGANQADIGTSTNPSNITLNVAGGTINRVFGGNNTSGNIYGSITVNVEKADDCSLDLNYVYGAGNQAAYAPTTAGAYPAVNILKGTVKKDVFGGGLGSTAVVTSNPTVKINGGSVTGNVFGGGSAANVKGNTTVTLTTGSAGSLYGGGEAASVLANGTTYPGNTSVSVAGGTVGNSIYGGGLGNTTTVAGNVAVSVSGGAITKDVYGGSGFGTVNTNGDNSTTVTISGGTVSGDIYGGGFGQVASGSNPAYAADVNGDVAVLINGGSMRNVFGCNNANGAPKNDVSVTVNGGTISNNIYGGGNLAAASVNPVVTINNGTFTGSVFGGGLGASAIITGNPLVTIGNNDDDQQVTIRGNVFGGGDAANVAGKPKVVINDCATVIGTYTGSGESLVWSTTDGTVYGGGNAADITGSGNGTNVIINGGMIRRAFGGGNGAGTDNPGANVAGNTLITIKGGTIGEAFGGSNAKGVINGTPNVVIDDEEGDCELNLLDLYGGGNETPSAGGSLVVEGCKHIRNVYGGANKADITSDIKVTIKSGYINNVFGGNNNSGAIKGKIVVNINRDGECWEVENVYGGGNLAVYSVYGYNTDGTPKTSGTKEYSDPEVHIINGKVNHNVFGAGKGDGTIISGTTYKGHVFGSPKVYVTGGSCENVYGGGDAAPVNGDTYVEINATAAPVDATNHVSGNVFGGGLGATAKINGSTTVKILGEETKIGGNVYGGGNAGDVTGDTNVQIGSDE